MKRSPIHARPVAALLVIFCLFAAPMTAFAKKGEKNYKQGLKYEQAQQWEKAAQEFTLAVAADPSNVEYQLHYRRAVFNASQTYMQQGRALAEQRDYIGAYNAFRQAYGYDPVNELALSEMERMLRLQREKTGEAAPGEGNGNGNGGGPRINQLSYRQGSAPGAGGVPAAPAETRNPPPEDVLPPQRTEQLRVIKYNGDLKGFIRNLAEQLSLNVIFDSQSFRAPRTVEVNLTDVTTAQALDLVFLQEGLFFQKVNRRTILVADQNRRAQYQQLSIRTFYLSNIAPDEARNIIAAAIPPNQGRPQTVVLPDKATNSITIRDTSENLRLIGEILQSIDKDRAEVVMDVNIYEVSRTDLLQFGNQLGTGSSDSGLFSLGSSSGLNITAGSREVAQALTNAPTALGAALVIPNSVLTAFQSKNRTKLLASTQIHAFNGEESSARIGQRVPVQTAQTYPFSTVPTTGTGTGGTGTTGGVFSGGFPVIQYEPTGLTLKFTPQVFPNLDVQVKMSIESKDILGVGSLTPTFTERTISGTARIQNNRTMMLASVAQDTQSNGRRGLPLLGLIPILGRLFTSPTRNNTQIDIVIAVTPRVLRAPAVTPFDERERPSGTLQTPTTGSLEAMVREADREDQLAAARRLPTHSAVQLPDTEPVPSYVPAPRAMMPSAAESAAATQPQPTEAKATNVPAPQPASGLMPERQQANALANAIAQLTGDAPPPPTPAQKTAAAELRAVPMAQQAGGPLRLPQTSIAAALEKSLAVKANTTTAAPSAATAAPLPLVAELKLTPERQEMRVGEKQRVALVLASKESLGAATARLRFDPKVLAVHSFSQGSWPDNRSSAPVVTQSIDPGGTITLVVSPQAGASFRSGENVILFFEVEALAPGEGVISFGPDAHVAVPAGRALSLQLTESRLTVK